MLECFTMCRMHCLHCCISWVPEADIDDAFPDDFPSWNPQKYEGPKGATLDGMLLTDLTSVSASEEGCGEQGLAPPAGTFEISTAHAAWTEERTAHHSQKKYAVHIA